jgi:hypothetical protein
MIAPKIITNVAFFIACSIACTAPTWAATIEYNENGRPVKFHGLMIEGQSHIVEVSWTSAKDTYETGGVFIEPKYWGDNSNATAAAEAMKQALLDDGFTPIALESYLMIPTSRFGTISGPGVYLHDDNLQVNSVAVGYSIYSGQVGFTKFLFFKDGFEDLDNVSPLRNE